MYRKESGEFDRGYYAKKYDEDLNTSLWHLRQSESRSPRHPMLNPNVYRPITSLQSARPSSIHRSTINSPTHVLTQPNVYCRSLPCEHNLVWVALSTHWGSFEPMDPPACPCATHLRTLLHSIGFLIDCRLTNGGPKDVGVIF